MDSSTATTVLLVEDNEDIREGLSTLLEAENYEVTPVGTAEDGMERLRVRSFHIIVTDYMLPGESGRWMVEQARREACIGKTPVLMITAHPRVEPPAGVHILHKPLDINEFLRAVEKVLTSASQRTARTG
ncbi:response regulator [Hyalangium rubrum]|uniref:Response regulator n=1 Tax=Hyalangium rubrum TaxID=3103134 RepID=A0ABU5HJ00_9BACT|nr:response regulator [Hyalangium sp. s54d21]MDY7232060.1 response regulator [Hyalangium sp. s54d21]